MDRDDGISRSEYRALNNQSLSATEYLNYWGGCWDPDGQRWAGQWRFNRSVNQSGDAAGIWQIFAKKMGGGEDLDREDTVMSSCW